MSIKCKHDCKDTTILDLLSHYSYFRFEFFVHRLFFLHFTLFYFISYFIFTQLTLGLDNMTHIFLFVSHLIHHSLLFCILSAWIYFIVLSLTLRFAILKRSRLFPKYNPKVSYSWTFYIHRKSLQKYFFDHSFFFSCNRKTKIH